MIIWLSLKPYHVSFCFVVEGLLDAVLALKRQPDKVEWAALATLQVKSGSGSCNEI